MFEFITRIFDTEGFPPRRYCGEAWTDGHAAIHIVSDFAIFGAYCTIPVLIGWFVLRRRDIPFPPILWLFSAFILCCGIGHAIEATIFWHPWYRLSAVLKIATAAVSWATVIAVVPIMPRALSLPKLEARQQALESEVESRRAAQAELHASLEELQTFTQSVVDREERIIELKNEVNRLLADAGQPLRYGGFGSGDSKTTS